MRRMTLIAGLLICIAFSGSAWGDAAPDTLSVSGVVDHSGEWTAARLKSELAADVTSITYTTHGQQHASTVVPLLSLLRAAGVQTQTKMDPKADPRTKNPELRLVVGVECRDGYAVMFSLAELLSDVGNRHVWIALDMDGQPLPPRDGPFRLIVPEDAKPARWAHGVQTIFVAHIAVPATQP